MARLLVAAGVALFAAGVAVAADPKPLWTIDVAEGTKATSAGWLGFSPDGKAVVAVVVRQAGTSPTYQYTLRVWNAADRKQRFTADLGTGKVPGWGDPLATFPTDESVLTGGHTLIGRDLTTGNQVSSQFSGGASDHAVWAVPDLRESFHLRRDPELMGQPLELVHRANLQQFDEFRGRRAPNREGLRQTTLDPPREGLRAEFVAISPSRTRVAVSFRDESATSRTPRHGFVLYRITTVEEFKLEPVAAIENPHPGSVTAVAFTPNSRILATGGDDGSIALWDATQTGSDWKPLATIEGVSDYRVFALAFRPDWRILAAITWDKTKPNLLLIDVDAGKLVGSVRLERELTTVAWSPDGRTLLTGGASGQIQAWDAAMLLKGK